MKERIQKLLANAGIDSRRNIEQMVLEGRVTVNGDVRRSLPILVDPQKDEIIVDGERVRLKAAKGEPVGGERIYVLLHKPRGVYATNVAQGVQKRAIDLLPKDFPRVYPVGRLDADSKGLLLLTNDGELTNQLTHPRYGIAKTFRATVEGSIAPGAIEDLERGVWLADKEGGKGYKTAPSRIKVLHRDRESTVLEITLREGRNRQAYRMLAKLGKVKDLTRTRIGPLTLDRLPSGEFRLLTPREVRELRQFVAEKTSRVSGQKPLARKQVRPRKKAGGARTEASRAR